MNEEIKRKALLTEEEIFKVCREDRRKSDRHNFSDNAFDDGDVWVIAQAQLDKAWDMAMMIGKDKGFLAGLEQGKKGGARILNQMALERCDPDVMPYFEDYYYLPKSVWQALKSQLEE